MFKMKITATEAVNRFGEVIDHVRLGNVVAVTRYGRVVVEIRPPELTMEAAMHHAGESPAELPATDPAEGKP